jgi:hypothetical protein
MLATLFCAPVAGPAARTIHAVTASGKTTTAAETPWRDSRCRSARRADILHPANAGFGRTQVHHIADLIDVGAQFVCAVAPGRRLFRKLDSDGAQNGASSLRSRNANEVVRSHANWLR